MATQALQVIDSLVPEQLTTGSRLPPVPWRDPHSVSSEQLALHIQSLEQACQQYPQNADLRTCLGMAYAMNYEAYKSMDALERARQLDPSSFWAQLKYAELNYRLRALLLAERETKHALELATDPMEMAVARHQLQEIRKLMREGTQKPEWTKPLMRPAFALVAVTVILCLVMVLR